MGVFRLSPCSPNAQSQRSMRESQNLVPDAPVDVRWEGLRSQRSWSQDEEGKGCAEFEARRQSRFPTGTEANTQRTNTEGKAISVRARSDQKGPPLHHSTVQLSSRHRFLLPHRKEDRMDGWGPLRWSIYTREMELTWKRLHLKQEVTLWIGELWSKSLFIKQSKLSSFVRYK